MLGFDRNKPDNEEYGREEIRLKRYDSKLVKFARDNFALVKFDWDYFGLLKLDKAHFGLAKLDTNNFDLTQPGSIFNINDSIEKTFGCWDAIGAILNLVFDKPQASEDLGILGT